MKRWMLAAGITACAAGAAFAYVNPAIFDEPVVLGPDAGSPRPVVVADATGDGILDVVVAATQSTAVHVHPGLGDGTFGDAFALTAGPEKLSRTLVAGRLNSDAYDDFVLDHGSSARVDVLLSDGVGGYSLARLPAAQGNAGTFEIAALADWDGDGDLDIVTSGQHLRLRRNDGSGGFGSSEVLLSGNGIGSGTMVVADLDGDGRLDVLVSGNRPLLYWRQTDGSLVAGSSQDFTGGHDIAITAADFDHDGRLDVAATRLDLTTGLLDGVDVFYQTSARTFAAPLYLGVQIYPGLNELDAADVNADGWVDLLATNQLFLNDGTGTLRLPQNPGDAVYWGNRGAVGISTGDLDADGRPEIVMTDGFGKTFVYATHADEPPGVAVDTMTPSTLGPGTTEITFSGVSFDPGVTVDLGRGIVVTGVTRESSTTVRATATVPVTARPVTRIAILRNSATSVATIPFQVVNAAAPQVVVTTLTPGSILPGESALVIVDGSGFAGPIVAGLLPGVQVMTTTVDSATRLTLDLTATTTATVGSRSLVLTDDWGDTVVPDVFDVLAAPTLDLAQATGRVRLKKHAARDSFSVEGTIAFNAASPDGTFDPSSEAAEIRYGDPAAPQVVAIPALKGWKVRRGRATWKSGKRATPRVTFSVDLSGGTFRLDVTRADLVLPGPDAQLALALGSEEGADVRPWETVRDGLRLR